MAKKTLKQKQKEYIVKYNGIPIDYKERLEWMYDQLGITDIMADRILMERERRMNNFYYTCIKIVLYQEPQGAKRPRYRVGSARVPWLCGYRRSRPTSARSGA